MGKEMAGRELGVGALKAQRREAFVQALASGLSQKKAYIAAGFTGSRPEKTGQNMAKSKWCKDRLDEIYAARIKESNHRGWLNQEAVLGKMKALYEHVSKPVPIVSRNGDETGHTRPADAGAAVRLINLMGLEVGMFNPEKKTRHGSLDSPLDKMNANELVKFVEGKLKALSSTQLEKLGFVPRSDTGPAELTVGECEATGESGHTPARPVRTLQ